MKGLDGIPLREGSSPHSNQLHPFTDKLFSTQWGMGQVQLLGVFFLQGSKIPQVIPTPTSSFS